ncbi:exosporium leader peptide-containing protein [Bacillus cereus group sp. BfR-BA-01346]|uniref:exosporium leader peptide-containing protein n=1 Tax=Bacillus cereus group sp. BfR-BA-01346 TaxID=2920309 RepID=UPI001F57EF43|nr:exosporium leader peptide-containing protein [Bacillus cereus group sp. BfR-BA-01346]
MDEFLSSAALNPGSVGPTLPPMQPFQFRTGPSGSTGAKGAIGNTEPYWHTGPPGIVLLTYDFKSLIISFAFRILPIS